MTDIREWLYAAGIRAVKTVAQTAVGVIGASAVLETVDWKVVISASALAGIVSLLTSVAGLPEVTVYDSNAADLEDSAYNEVENLTEKEE